MSKILIVDDNPANIKILQVALSHDSYHLYAAKNGIEALALAYQIRPDIILLDVMMPNMSGFEVCEKLKSSELTTDIPIIFITALDEETDKLHGLSIGGEDYITKPFSMEEVAARVRVHLALLAKQRELKLLREQDHQYFTRINAIRDNILDQMRHDIRSPLASIKTSLHLINKITTDQIPKIKGYTERISAAVDETLQVMERLLEVAKLETGRIVTVVDVELVSYILNIIKTFEPLAEAKSINLVIKWDILLDDVTVFLDPDQMASAIRNLIGNAIKYTAVGGEVSIQVSHEQQSLIIEIADTGRGIPEEHISKIFDQYYRVPLAKDEIEGTGLGLYIVKSIVALHGGTIQVKSELNKGSVFTIVIPQPQVSKV